MILFKIRVGDIGMNQGTKVLTLNDIIKLINSLNYYEKNIIYMLILNGPVVCRWL